jgi:RNA polymerase sigma-70 factor (family 1)
MASDQLNINLLITQLNRGSIRAFDRLYGLYSKDLLRNVYYQVKDKEVAKDITQEVFMIVWRRRESIDPERSIKPYLNVIARNLMIKAFQKRIVDRQFGEELLRNGVNFHPSPDEAMEYKETLQIINRAIDTLSQQQKTIYQKCRMEGKSHEEIANELGISKATVNNHITTANRLVTAYLQKYAQVHPYDRSIFLLFLWMIYKA